MNFSIRRLSIALLWVTVLCLTAASAGPSATGTAPADPVRKQAHVAVAQGGTVSGELVKWHPVTVGFAGPTASETDNSPNPFLDYRLTVTFSGPGGRTHVVPGFFDGDGNGGGNGNVWRARFAPDAAGQWTYTASFRSGNNVAVSLDASAGSPASFDGATGSFSVADRDGSAPGFLKWGRLEYVGQHYLKFADGPHWIKGGVDSPESFMGYADFDNTIDQGCKGIVHEYGPHVQDWQPGDPTWTGEDGVSGKGKGIIGALNYLSSEQVNSIYFLPMNLGGDGCETYPFVGASGSDFDNTHYDISKLSQWNTVLAHAQEQGIALQIVLNETEAENEQWLDGRELTTQRKLFYRELVARFSYLSAIKWNLCEETDNFGSTRLKQFADYISALDWAEHQMTVHITPNKLDTYDALLGNPNFDATSIQYAPELANDHVETMRQRSADAGRPWVIDMDENNPAGEGLNDTNAPELRKEVLYDVYFSGGNIEWYFGKYELPLGGDRDTENFRTREEMYRYMWSARAFMQENLPFWEMEPADDLLGGEDQSFGGGQVFAKPGEVYAVYFPVTSSESALLDLSDAASESSFTVRWFNPRSGQFEGSAKTVSGGGALGIGIPPGDQLEDWVLLVQRSGGPAPTFTPQPTSTPLPTSPPQPTATPPAASPTPTTPPSGSAVVVSLTLVNADTNQDIRQLVDDDTINFAELPTRNLNVRANTSPAVVDQLRFAYDDDDNYQTENNPPYTLGDRNGDYDAWTPSLGEHTLRAVPIVNGQEGTALTVNFTVVDNASQPTPTPVADEGVRYAYYEGDFRQLPDFDALVPVAEGETDAFTLDVRQRDDDFALRFESCLTVETAGTYTFYTRSDDGTQLFVDGGLVVNNDGQHAARERSGQVTLEASTYALEVIFFEHLGKEVLDVLWSGPGVSKQPIPTGVLSTRGCETSQPQSALVSGFLFVDENNNGQQDENEPGLEAATVTLTEADGDASYSATTDADGYYAFPDIDELGTYVMSLALPADYAAVSSSTMPLTIDNLGNLNAPAFGVIRNEPGGTVPNADGADGLFLPLVVGQ